MFTNNMHMEIESTGTFQLDSLFQEGRAPWAVTQRMTETRLERSFLLQSSLQQGLHSLQVSIAHQVEEACRLLVHGRAVGSYPLHCLDGCWEERGRGLVVQLQVIATNILNGCLKRSQVIPATERLEGTSLSLKLAVFKHKP